VERGKRFGVWRLVRYSRIPDRIMDIFDTEPSFEALVLSFSVFNAFLP
jgi:hypothetical protein